MEFLDLEVPATNNTHHVATRRRHMTIDEGLSYVLGLPRSRGQTDDSALVDNPGAGDVACVGAAVHSLSQDR
jgi:hypothetical protein